MLNGSGDTCGQVDLARERGDKTIVFRAKNVHESVGLKNQMPNVCQVLKGDKFHEMCRVEITRCIGSPPSGQGPSLTIEFRVLQAV